MLTAIRQKINRTTQVSERMTCSFRTDSTGMFGGIRGGKSAANLRGCLTIPLGLGFCRSKPTLSMTSKWCTLRREAWHIPQSFSLGAAICCRELFCRLGNCVAFRESLEILTWNVKCPLQQRSRAIPQWHCVLDCRFLAFL